MHTVPKAGHRHRGRVCEQNVVKNIPKTSSIDSFLTIIILFFLLLSIHMLLSLAGYKMDKSIGRINTTTTTDNSSPHATPNVRSTTPMTQQMKDFLKLYSGLVERCFTDCVNDFTSKALTS